MIFGRASAKGSWTLKTTSLSACCRSFPSFLFLSRPRDSDVNKHLEAKKGGLNDDDDAVEEEEDSAMCPSMCVCVCVDQKPNSNNCANFC